MKTLVKEMTDDIQGAFVTLLEKRSNDAIRCKDKWKEQDKTIEGKLDRLRSSLSDGQWKKKKKIDRAKNMMCWRERLDASIRG
jgi:hypothetical protein